jgi:succinate dehydrogenase / fumarate reductase flavoprotein subunit
MWDYCGMARSEDGLNLAIDKIQKLRAEFWKNLKILGTPDGINMELERAGRVADFLEFGELMCRDALTRNESCGGHFRTEYQTPEGEALRNDDEYAFVSAWEYQGENQIPTLNKEPLVYEKVKLATRSYK